jgi:hypothetical protein
MRNAICMQLTSFSCLDERIYVERGSGLFCPLPGPGDGSLDLGQVAAEGQTVAAPTPHLSLTKGNLEGERLGTNTKKNQFWVVR